jgi:formate dehydrogenase subunit beta
MLIGRVIEVEGNNPATALNTFLSALLEGGVAERLFAPVGPAEGGGDLRFQPIRDAADLSRADPLQPIMLENAAIALRQAMELEPQASFAAVLRPCEVRAVIEMAKRDQFDLNRLVIIGLDCASTYTLDYYRETETAHPDDPRWLMHEALQLAQAGRIEPENYRLACQLCDRPAADYAAADILIGLIGVDTSKQILVLANEREDVRFKLHKVTAREATEREMVEREVMMGHLVTRRQQAASRKLDELGLSDGHMGVIMGYMSKCTLCGNCVEACPVCSEDLKDAFAQGKQAFISAFVTQSTRMISCSNCGMCHTHCPEDIPLCAISYVLGRQIQTRMRYTPGRSAGESLPWM